MSAQSRDIKIVPRDRRDIPREQRLRITAEFNHGTVQYAGNVFDFIQRLIDEQRAGIATLRLGPDGSFYGMEFDFREPVSNLAIDKSGSSEG